MSDEDFFAAYFMALSATLLAKKRSKKRREWRRTWLGRRKSQGCYENLMRELAFEDPDYYRRWLRMDVDSFEYLLSKLSSSISKRDTVMRESISAGERLALTLRYLATGESQTSLGAQFRIAQNTISGIIPAVCSAIFEVLKPEVLVCPTTPEEWQNVAERFYNLWNFPLCLGAMDGKHIKIVRPPHSGSNFFNFKRDYSIVLLAVVDADLKFLYIDVGTNGRISDGGVWAKTAFKKHIERNDLNVPDPEELPGTRIKLPYVIVADDAFPLSTYLMKPFAGKDLDHEQVIFNYRLSRARRVAENAFGILAGRFQIFKTSIDTSPVRCRTIVAAACTLHNFLRSRSASPQLSIDVEDFQKKKIIPGEWREMKNGMIPFRRARGGTSHYAKEVRDVFSAYFNTCGAVPWQNDMCYLH